MFNPAVAWVDARITWRTRDMQKSIETLQRLVTEMSTSIADRLLALEASALNKHDDGVSDTDSQ